VLRDRGFPGAGDFHPSPDRGRGPGPLGTLLREPAGRGLAIAGLVLGYLGPAKTAIVLTFIVVAIFVVTFVVVAIFVVTFIVVAIFAKANSGYGY
jgi:hypothetical protein